MADHFIALILDNEVTVGEFVATPPLSWTRLVQRSSTFEIAEGYPNILTAAQAKFEMTNWDQVSLPAIMRALAEQDDSVDYFLFGNNAGQGFPLAQSLPANLIATVPRSSTQTTSRSKAHMRSSATEPFFGGAKRAPHCRGG